MKAMIFAAGKGTRLKPLTDNKPKALVEIHGKPLIEHVINKLKYYGFHEIIINIHYLGDQIVDYLNTKNNFDIRIEISDESKELLDTGGGLKKASWFFDDKKPFVVYNTDIISDLNLNEMLDGHIRQKALASLAVRKRLSSRYLLFNENFELTGWKNVKTSEKIITQKSKYLTELAFSGVHILNPDIFKYMNQLGKFSVVDSYLELTKEHRITGFDHTSDYWFDIGTIHKLKTAEDYLNKY